MAKKYPDYATRGYKLASQRAGEKKHSDYPPAATARSHGKMGFWVERPATIGSMKYSEHNRAMVAHNEAIAAPSSWSTVNTASGQHMPGLVTRRKKNDPFYTLEPLKSHLYKHEEKEESIADAWAEFENDDDWQAITHGF